VNGVEHVARRISGACFLARWYPENGASCWHINGAARRVRASLGGASDMALSRRACAPLARYQTYLSVNANAPDHLVTYRGYLARCKHIVVYKL